MSWWKRFLGIETKPVYTVQETQVIEPVMSVTPAPVVEPEKVPLSTRKKPAKSKPARKPKAPGHDGRARNTKVKNRTKTVE